MLCLICQLQACWVPQGDIHLQRRWKKTWGLFIPQLSIFTAIDLSMSSFMTIKHMTCRRETGLSGALCSQGSGCLICSADEQA